MAWAMVAGAAISVVGGVVASNKAKKSANEQAAAAEAMNDKQLAANAVDPRIQQMLYGDGTKRLKPGVESKWHDPDGNGFSMTSNPASDYESSGSGLLGQYTDALNKPQSAAMQQYGQTAGDYLGKYGSNDVEAIRANAIRQTMGIQAPQMQAEMINGVPMVGQSQIQLPGTGAAAGGGATARPPSAMMPDDVKGVAVGGPGQNSLDLSGYFDKTINAAPGQNPFLKAGVEGGMAQSKNYFDQMQFDSSKNLREMILPSVRGGAIASGQYGGTRQGIAEGRAMGDFATEQQRAITQFGQNNTNAATAAYSAAYETDSNRALSAAQGLSGQQNAAAIASANNQQAANMTNFNGQLNNNQFNAGLLQQRDMQSQSLGTNAAIEQARMNQGANFANQNAILGVGQTNMGAANSAGHNNLQAQLTTNQLNSNNMGAGNATLGGLLGNAYGTAGTQDQYDINKMSNGMGVLAPYLAKNATPTQLQPVYNNSSAAGLGGAIAGAQLGQAVYNGFNSGATTIGKPPATSGQGFSGGPSGQYYDGYGWNPN